MKKSKGFTLIELLAVIIILGILLTIVGTSAISSKKKANDEELKKQAKMLADLAPGIYSHEKIMSPSGEFMQKWRSTTNDNSFYIKDAVLIKYGYLDGEIKSPYTGKDCESYLEFKKNSNDNGDYKYIGHISCDNGKHKVDSDGGTTYNNTPSGVVGTLTN